MALNEAMGAFALRAFQTLRPQAIARLVLARPEASAWVQRFADASDAELAAALADIERSMPGSDWAPVFCWIQDHPKDALAVVAEVRHIVRNNSRPTESPERAL